MFDIHSMFDNCFGWGWSAGVLAVIALATGIAAIAAWELVTARFRAPKPLSPNLAVVAELRRCFSDLKLIEAPHLRLQERWRQAFLILCSTVVKTTAASAQLGQLGFGVDQVEQLLDWRATRPQVLITLLLLLVAGLPDDDVWALAEKAH